MSLSFSNPVVITVACYIVLTVATVLGVPTLLTMVPAILIGPMFSAFAVWTGIAFAWQWVEGEPMPIAMFIAAFLWVGWTARDSRLTAGGVHMAGGEQWGIFLCAIASAIFYNDTVRWY